jgi:hypothetical protein
MNIGFKVKGVKSVLDALNIREHRALIKGATNTAGGKTFTQSRRIAKKRYNLQAKISEIPFEKKKATADNLTYKVITTTRMRNIATMFRGIKQTKAGVKAEIVKGNKKVIQGAFIARPSGNDYSTRGQSRKVTQNRDLVLQRKGSSAYPLQGVGNTAPKGISWAMILLNNEVKRNMADVFTKEYENSYGVRLNKLLMKRTAGV